MKNQRNEYGHKHGIWKNHVYVCFYNDGREIYYEEMYNKPMLKFYHIR